MLLQPQVVSFLFCATLVVAMTPCAVAADEALLLSLDACIADVHARDEAASETDDEPVASADAAENDGEDADEPELSELESFCPEVHAGLKHSSLAPYLEPDWENRVSAGKLERVRAILAEEPRAATQRLDTGSLAGIVERMQSNQVKKERSLWQRFKDWVRQLIERQAAEQDSGRFADWLREHWPSGRVLGAVALGILALLLGGIAWIIYVELRAAGLIGRRRPTRDAREGPLAPAGERRPVRSLAEASDAELPGLLVALLLEQLRRLGWAHDRLSMTHRELVRAVRFDSATDTETFLELLRLCERLRYAPAVPAASAVRAVVDGARRLLDGLMRQSPRTA